MQGSSSNSPAIPAGRRGGGRCRVATVTVAAAVVLAACTASGPASDPGATSPTGRHAGGPTTPTPPTSQPTTPVAVPRGGADCLRPGDAARSVRFGPGRRLGGYLIGSGDRYVVLAHQSMGDSCQMLPLARALASAGFHALAFDFHGTESSALANTDGILAGDVLSALGFCRSLDARSVSLVGASMGGYAVLNAALLARPPVSAVVSLSAPAQWDDPRGRTLDLAPLHTPTQLWAARYDTSFADAARTLARSQPDAQLVIEPGYGHGVELVPAGIRRIVAFLDAHT